MASQGAGPTAAQLRAHLRAGQSPFAVEKGFRNRWHAALQQVIVEDFRASAYGDEYIIVGRMNGQYMGSEGGRWGSSAKRLGALAGECDLGLAGFSHDKSACGLEIEIKIKPDVPSEVQKAHHAKLRARGLRVEVVHDLQEFWKVVDEYFGAAPHGATALRATALHV